VCFGRRTSVLTHFTTQTAGEKLRSGTLAGQMDEFAAWLWGRGYSRSAGYPHLRVAAAFSRWPDSSFVIGSVVGDAVSTAVIGPRCGC
jgi:hypothetical protein